MNAKRATRGQDKPAAAKKRTKPDKTKVKQFLKAHGHKASAVDALPLDSAAQITASLLVVHGVSAVQYTAGKQ